MATKTKDEVLTEGRIVTLACHIKGLVPCIMANGQMADPANYWARQAAEIRGERKRGKTFTEEQADRYYKTLFTGQLYLKDRKNLAIPYWPAENVEAMIRSGAKKSRSGSDALLGITVTEDFPLVYDGPPDAEGLYADERFRFQSLVRSKAGTTVNVRCRFQQWEFRFDVMLDTRLADVKTFERWLDDASWQVGLSAWAPKYGRFEVLSVKGNN